MIPAFSDKVLEWYGLYGRRGLPWQRNPIPYRVWISEIMLQQTQVATVVPYYKRFMNSYPGIDVLAVAGIDEVLHHWSGLGYYARARNLHKAAQVIHADFGGVFPTDFASVVSLPGIGRSTAGAILALSRGERHAILDGNVKRVLARHHAVEGWPGKTTVANALWQHAESHTPERDVADYTQAMMDLGATVCTRTRPVCNECPLAGSCAAHGAGRETDFPGKREKKVKPRRKTHMLLLHCDNRVFLERRPAAGIWGGLWSFPELGPEEELADWCESELRAKPADITKLETLHHSFTHFDLEIEPITVRVNDCSSKVTNPDDGTWYELASPQTLGIAAPVNGLIQKLREQYNNVQNG